MTSLKTHLGDLCMPLISFGHYRGRRYLSTEQCIAAIEHVGLRGIDTAQGYLGKTEIRQALAQTEVPREELFVTSKISPAPRGSKIEVGWHEYVQGHLDNDLGLEYVDLLLVHEPGIADAAGRKELWATLESFVDAGRVRFLGSSNYGVNQLKDLLSYARIKPVLNQIEVHPWFRQQAIVDFCAEQGIVVEAYGVMAVGEGVRDPTLTAIGQKHGVSAAQVLMRWTVDQGRPFIIRSSSHHLAENVELADIKLDDDDIRLIDSLDVGRAGQRCPAVGGLE